MFNKKFPAKKPVMFLQSSELLKPVFRGLTGDRSKNFTPVRNYCGEFFIDNVMKTKE